VSRYQKGQTDLDFTEARDGEWQWHQLGWAVCKSAPRSGQITTPAPHRSVEFQVGFVELCAKILQIMRHDFKDYARTFCQLFLPIFAKKPF